MYTTRITKPFRIRIDDVNDQLTPDFEGLYMRKMEETYLGRCVGDMAVVHIHGLIPPISGPTFDDQQRNASAYTDVLADVDVVMLDLNQIVICTVTTITPERILAKWAHGNVRIGNFKWMQYIQKGQAIPVRVANKTSSSGDQLSNVIYPFGTQSIIISAIPFTPVNHRFPLYNVAEPSPSEIADISDVWRRTEASINADKKPATYDVFAKMLSTIPAQPKQPTADDIKTRDITSGKNAGASGHKMLPEHKEVQISSLVDPKTNKFGVITRQHVTDVSKPTVNVIASDNKHIVAGDVVVLNASYTSAMLAIINTWYSFHRQCMTLATQWPTSDDMKKDSAIWSTHDRFINQIA